MGELAVALISIAILIILIAVAVLAPLGGAKAVRGLVGLWSWAVARLTALWTWARNPDRVPWIVYILFLAGGTALAVFLLWSGTAGTKTTEIERIPKTENGAIISDELMLEEKTTETSIPVTTVITALLGGGWLALPLKFLWDERAKKNDYLRQISTKMLETIHPLVERYYTPEINRIHGVNNWATKLRDLLAESKSATPADPEETRRTFRRLLYETCRYHELTHRMGGVMLFFRSTAREQRVRNELYYLHEALTPRVTRVAEADALLARAVSPTDQPERLVGDSSVPSEPDKTDHAIDFIEFSRRLDDQTPDGEWKTLHEIADAMREHFETPGVLTDICTRAESVIEKYEAAITELYREWYETSTS